MSSPAATPPASGHSTPRSQSRSRSPFFWSRPSNETVEDIVNITKTVLETGKDFLELAPVPGLSAAVGSAITILEQVKKTKANKKTVKEFCERTVELKTTLDGFKTQLEVKINTSEQGLQAEVKAKVEHSDDLKNRIAQLAKKIDELCNSVSHVGKGGAFQRFLSASREEDALKDAADGIAKAITDFQVVGGITVEMLVENIVGTAREIRREQEAAAKRELEILERQKEAAERQREAAERQKEAERRQQMEEDARTLKELLASESELTQATDRPRNEYAGGTRAEVFERLETWRNGTESIFYLSGQLGRGKSVIASEFCHRYHRDVAAYFFFKRGNGAASSVERLVPVIAYQLAEACVELRPHIVQAAKAYVQRRKSLPIDELVKVLLSTPFETAARSPDSSTSWYIVIDAVDECTDSDSLSSQFLAHFLPCIQASSFIRLLITSRPSPSYISDAIHKHPTSDCTTLSLDSDVTLWKVNRDIGVAIDDIFRKNPASSVWYAKRSDVREILLSNAGGLFVYACTAARFLSNVEEWSVDASMKALWSKERPYGLDDLEILYVNVLDAAFPKATTIPDTVQAVRTILECLALGDGYLRPDDLNRLLAIPCNQSISILQKLCSVIQFDPPDDDTRFTPIHVTFGDFLLRPTSQSPTDAHFPYHVDPAVFHARLAVACVSDIHNHGFNSTGYADGNWFRHFSEAVKAQESGTISKAEPNEAADLLKELTTLLENIVRSMDTNKPSIFFRWFDVGLPGNNPDEIATLLRWIDPNVSRDVARVFAEWIGMWLPEHKIEMNDTIVVTMREDTLEEEEIKDALKAQLVAQVEKLWPVYPIGLVTGFR